MTETATIQLDPHVHTGASYDGHGSVRELLTHCHNGPLDAVAITDHDTTVAAREAVSLQERYDVTVVPGVEVSTADGHVLGIGIRDRRPVGEPLATSVARIRNQGGLAVVPHPFQLSRHGVRKRDLTACDGIEVFNAWSMTGIQNRRAKLFAARNDYPQLGASDAHTPETVGRGCTEVELPDTADELSADAILDALAAGRTRPVGESTSARRYIGKYTRSVGRQVLDRVD